MQHFDASKELLYWKQREIAERCLAARARVAAVRTAHEQLAELYEGNAEAARALMWAQKRDPEESGLQD